MHKENYNINIICFCNKNISNALEELKSFFGFNLHLDHKNLTDLKQENINAIISDIENSKKISLYILINQKYNSRKWKNFTIKRYVLTNYKTTIKSDTV